MPTINLQFTDGQASRIKTAMEDQFGPLTNVEALERYKEFLWSRTRSEVRRVESDAAQEAAEILVTDLGPEG